MNPEHRLIVALDFSSRDEAEALIALLGDAEVIFKIGYQQFYGGDGLSLGRELIAAGSKVFFDLKLLDIDNTVARGVEAIAATGAHFLTVHAYPQAMDAAVAAARGSDLKLLGVTVLTSMDNDDLVMAGYDRDLDGLVGLRAHQAKEAGMGGIVCAPSEAALARKLAGPDLAVVTPGVRPAGSAMDDQKRVTTPAEAIQAGASHVVIGRPITKAADPAAALRVVLAELASAAP
jgi:orotidine-5'-phosphate decarboxylase